MKIFRCQKNRCYPSAKPLRCRVFSCGRDIINLYPRVRQAKTARGKSARTCISPSVALALGICFPLTMETNFNRTKKIRAALPAAADAGNASATPFTRPPAPAPGAGGRVKGVAEALPASAAAGSAARIFFVRLKLVSIVKGKHIPRASATEGLMQVRADLPRAVFAWRTRGYRLMISRPQEKTLHLRGLADG